MDDIEGRLRNCRNVYQLSYPRVLCVCSAGLLRSPTLAWVLSQDPYNCNVRIAGIRPEYALVPVDDVLLAWADHVVCVNRFERELLQPMIDKYPHGDLCKLKIWELKIPDQYPFRHPELVKIIQNQLKSANFPEYKHEH